MSAFRPITPHAAIQIFDDADIRVDSHRLLANLAMAGVVRSYAQVVETSTPGMAVAEVRNGRINRAIWRRIVAEEKIADIYQDGSVHLRGDSDTDTVSVIGIRFDVTSVRGAAADHGNSPPAQPNPNIAQNEAIKSPSPRTITTAASEPDAHPADAAPRRATIEAGAIAMSVQEAASVLGVAVGTVYKEIDRGRLKSTKTGRRRLVSVESIRSMLSGEAASCD